MTREEQIEIVATKFTTGRDNIVYVNGFKAGATWADSNPLEFIGDLVTQRSIAFDEARDAKQMLAVAVEALKYTQKTSVHIGNDENGNVLGIPDKIMMRNVCRDALAKIEKIKSGLRPLEKSEK